MLSPRLLHTRLVGNKCRERHGPLTVALSICNITMWGPRLVKTLGKALEHSDIAFVLELGA